MSDWRDRLPGPDNGARGSFRGVKFYYEQVEAEVGRRTVTRDHPGRDEPTVEDLGRRARRLTFDLYVLGPDYDVQRDQLRDAFEQPGPGQLVHPYWGTLTVSVDGPVRITETTGEQGIARFSVTFVEGGATLAAMQASATTSRVEVTATALEDAAVESFSSAWSVFGLLADALASLAGFIERIADTINSVRRRIAAALILIDDLASAVTDLADAASSLLATPALIASTLRNLISSVVGAIDQIGDAFDAALAAFGSDESAPADGSVLAASTRTAALEQAALSFGAVGDDVGELPAATSRQARLAACTRQLTWLTQSFAAAEISRTAAKLTYDNADRALSTQAAVVRLIDKTVANPELPDDLYTYLADLRAAVIEHLRAVASTLPVLVDYVPPTTAPALVLAYRLHGDHARETELLLRNPQVRDPSAVPGGRPLKVASDE